MILKLLKPLSNFLFFVNYNRDRLRLRSLMSQGMKVGKNVYIGPDVFFDHNYPYLMEIGDNCRISYGVQILVHDATAFKDVGVTRVAPVRILEGSFIGSQAIILPGTTIGPRAMVAAGAVVNRDIPEDKLAAGNPARPYGNYSELLENHRQTAISSPVFNRDEWENGQIPPSKILSACREFPVAFTAGIPRKDPYYVNTDFEAMKENARTVFNEQIKAEKK